MRINSVAVLLILGVVTLAGGCGSPGYNLHVSLTQEMQQKLGDDRVFVHVLGVNPSDREQFENLNLSDYWKFSGSKKAIAHDADTKILELSSDHPEAVLDEKDPLWTEWLGHGDSELMVLSSRPIPDASLPAASDPRRRFIPSSKAAWTSNDVQISVTPGGLRVQTGRAPTR